MATKQKILLNKKLEDFLSLRIYLYTYLIYFQKINSGVYKKLIDSLVVFVVDFKHDFSC